jgi:hypothetical protein
MWFEALRFSPFPRLLSSKNENISYFVRKDLLVEETSTSRALMDSPITRRIASRQLTDGSWPYNVGKSKVRSRKEYNQLETFRMLGQLVELCGLTRSDPIIRNAVEYLFHFQTKQGDFRGIYANQYTPNYTAAIMELLIKAGYADDDRIEKGFSWLISIRQNDGGWAIPFRTVGYKGNNSLTWIQAFKKSNLIEPDKSAPSSHCITGVVLRAFAAHPRYRSAHEAKLAGELLGSRFFKEDRYSDRKAVRFWTSFVFPFWFTDLLSASDSLSLIGFGKEDAEIQVALKWFSQRQNQDGLWKVSLLKSKSIGDMELWITLAICRVFKRVFG